MKKTLFIIGAVVVVGIIAVGAYVLRPPAEATAPIEAIPLATATSQTASTAPTAPGTVNQTAAENSAYPAPEETISSGATGSVVFAIAQAESQVRFTLNEDLRGVPTTVIGVSDQVAGELAIDFSNPANSQLGVILVNARTLATNNSFRNNAIQNEILQTGPYEYITFTPTALTGLPATIAVGETITFQITGDLTIRNVTQPVTFEASVTLVSESRIEGLASVTVLRSNYGLVIPRVPSVANVTDEVLLEIEFVAVLK